jgi:tetratricopeptide (TPR) repeat protein
MIRTPATALAALLAAACATPRNVAPTADARPPAAESAPPPTPGAAPRSARSAMAEGEAALARNDLAAAEAAFAEAARLDPRDAGAPAGLARVRMAQGRSREAGEAADRSLALGETAGALAVRGRVALSSRRADAAVPDLARAAALAPGDVDAPALLAVAQLHRGDAYAARAAYAMAVERGGRLVALDRFWTHLIAAPVDGRHPVESLDRCARAWAELLEGRSADAERDARAGLRYAPKYAFCKLALAQAAAALEQPERAERLLREASADVAPGQEPVAADVRGRLALHLATRGAGAQEPARAATLAEARRLAEQALGARGARPALHEALARACDALGDVRCAREAWSQVAAAPTAPELLRRTAAERVAALDVRSGSAAQ